MFFFLEHFIREDPFRAIVIVTAHSNDREIMREVLQRTHGGQFVFKDAEDLQAELRTAVAVALAHPAYSMSRAIRRFRAMLDEDLSEDDYRKFIHQHYCDRVRQEPQLTRGYEARKGLGPVSTNRPRGFLVIGRYTGPPEQRKAQRDRVRLENSYYAGLSLVTYDDLAERAEQHLRLIHAYRATTPDSEA